MIEDRDAASDPDAEFDSDEVELSIVIPVRDEQGSLPTLISRLQETIEDLGATVEIIFVDDGSCDATLAVLTKARKSDPRIRVVSLSRNFGHQIAISAGLAHASGEAVVVMDGDLQDPPEAIGTLWARLREGFDVVYAIRRWRPEPIWLRWAYSCFYRLLRNASSIDVPVDAGDFAILSRRVVNVLCAMPEQRRFLRGMGAWAGFRQTGLPIDRGVRFRGRSKFTLGRLLSLAFDGFFGLSESPLRFFGIVGAVSAVCSLIFLLYACVGSAALGKSFAGWAWVGGLIGLFGGSGLLAAAVLGEYMCRILRELNGRPLYVVAKRLGFEERWGDAFIASSSLERNRRNQRGFWDAPGDDSLRDPQSLH